MKRILVAYDYGTTKTVIMGDKLQLDGDGCVKITRAPGDELVAHVKGYDWVAFEDSVAPQRPVEDPDALA